MEGSKTDFSIVAPKTEQNEFGYSQSELDLLDPIRDKENGSHGQRSLYFNNQVCRMTSE